MPIGAFGDDAVETLLDRAFGRDRHERTAYRIRAGGIPIAGLSFATAKGSALIGTIQCWPVAHVADDGRSTPLTMVGPVAVEPAHQRDGIGQVLMRAMLRAADFRCGRVTDLC